MDKYIGKRLDGRYEITELIGQGGMSEVYRANDVLDNKVVAVKILKREFSGNEEFLRRFRNESKAIAVLSHPNIVKIYDMGFSEKLQYIVMEYIDGITLKDYIDSEHVLNWKDAVHFIIQILRALQHAHNRGIVHRDIKPQNIMLFTDGTIKVMDFGIAKFAREGSMTATDQTIGTVHYISPEQARGDVTDEKSDIYSVGVMFYEMLTGRKPFDTEDPSDNPISIAVMHMQNIPTRPRDINPNIPSALEEIIMHAMEKDSENRYQTASDMIKDIEAFKNNNQIIFGYYNVAKVQAAVSGRTAHHYTAPPPIRQKPRNYPLPEQPVYDNDDDNDEFEMDEPVVEERQKSLIVPILTAVTVVVIVVAAVFIVALLTNPNLLKAGKIVEVPNLIGMSYNDAQSAYQNNIIFSVEEEDYNDEFEAGIIYRQSEEAGTELDKGDNGKVRIAIAVSRGTRQEEVPDVVNLDENAAKELLDSKGFIIQIMNEASTPEENIEKGHAIRTNPKAGESVKAGSTIVLYLSTGIASEEIKVPQFVGKTLEEAKVECVNLNLKIANTEEIDSDKPAGEIISQSLEEGKTVNSGAEITFQVSNGNSPKGDVTYGLYLPTDISGKYTLDFTADGQVVKSYSFVAESAGGMVAVTLSGEGQKQVIVSVTGENSGATARLGIYQFDFPAGVFYADTEDIDAGFAAVTVMNEPATAPPAAQPQVVQPQAGE